MLSSICLCWRLNSLHHLWLFPRCWCQQLPGKNKHFPCLAAGGSQGNREALVLDPACFIVIYPGLEIQCEITDPHYFKCIQTRMSKDSAACRLC